MTSSTKLEIHNATKGGLSHCHRQTCTNVWWILDMRFLRYACRQTDMYTSLSHQLGVN